MSETLLNGRYRLVSQQGSGGMAVIYKAIDEDLGRTVAVKILRPSLTGDPEFLIRFREEARNVAKLSHPNIVTVYDVGSNTDPNTGQQTHYIVMEFVDGSDLKKLIRKRGALPVEEALELSIQICAGIGFAHEEGLVHADVKPQNILLTSSQQVKVTDFGIAQAFNPAPPTGNTEPLQVVWGSPHYFSPEQAQGGRPRTASDVYSIGVVMFEMLTGQLPYTGANQQELALAHIQTPVPRVTDVSPQVPEALSRVVYKVMSKEPDQRYRRADQLGQILVSYRQRGQQSTLVNQRGAPQEPVNMPPPPAQEARYQRPGTQQPDESERPLYYEPVQPQNNANSEPTQRYSIAPQAPPPPPQQRGQQTPASVSAPMQQEAAYTQGDSAAYTGPSRPISREDYESNGIDAITIILAFLALIAVLCLLPLYYLVYLAYR